jgi:hypothetical protein
MATLLHSQVWENILLYLYPKEASNAKTINKSIYGAYCTVAKQKLHRVQLYEHFRAALTAIGLKWKDYEKLHPLIHPYFTSIKELRANQASISDKICMKGCLLEIPSQILPLFNRIYIPATKQLLTFEEYLAKKDEIKEVIKANSYLEFTNSKGDIMKISKAIVAEQDSEDTEEKISLESFYKEDEETKVSNIDFENTEMLKKRQSKLLAKCKIAPKIWNPFELITNIGIWIIILCHGGKFSIAIFNKGKLIEHKSDSKYVLRAKAGQRQISKDKSKVVMKSVGSQMRRANEKLHEAHIEKIMQETKHYVEEATAIFLHSPGINKYYFLLESKSLYEHRDKVYSIPFKTTKAKFTEAMEVMKKLTTVKFSLVR